MEKQSTYAHPTGFALGLTAGMVYSICAAVVWLWPAQSVRFLASWFHGIDITRIAVTPQFTFGTFFSGLIGIMIATYIVGLIYGWTYAKCVAHCKRMGWIR